MVERIGKKSTERDETLLAVAANQPVAAKKIMEITGLKPGALYPTLQEFITAEWITVGSCENLQGREVKAYSLTPIAEDFLLENMPPRLNLIADALSAIALRRRNQTHDH